MFERWLSKKPDPADLLRQGNAALAAGDLAAAAGHYRAAVSAAPRDAAAHLNLGFVMLEQGDAVAASASLEQAIALGGGADAHFMLGQALAAQQRWNDARSSYEEALRLQPDFGFAWRGLGIALEQLADPGAALAAYENAAHHAPQLVDAIGACARLQSQLGRDEEAVATARRWAGAAPREWAAPFVEGQSLHALKRSEEAMAALDRAATLAPGHAPVEYTRGNVLFALGRAAEAERAYALALASAPDWIEARANRGVALDRLARHEEALRCFDEVLARDPRHKVSLYWRPIVLLALRREDEAMEAVARARSLHPQDPDMEWHYAFTHLLAGRMREGWPAYESRWKAPSVAASLSQLPFREPTWTGQPLEGKTLLLYPEQGLGDMLQFIRFVPRIEALGARVLVWAPQPLVSLLTTVSPDVQVACRLEDLPPFDLRCPVMSVPLALGVTLDDLPGPVPYLSADPGVSARWAERLGPKQCLRVGVVWSGNAAQPNDRNRSIPLATFSRVATEGCEFVALQNMVRREDEAALAAWPSLKFFGDELRTFADTAALASQMDVIVSVCTSGAHLAGALGLPLWVLLGWRADWRWLLEREDSPWYPTARLFRQDAGRDWDAVIDRVRSALKARASV